MGLFSTDPPILAVDVANMAHRAYHANKHLSIGSGADEQPTGHVYGSVKILLPLIKKFSKGGRLPTLWWALEGSPARRQEIYPEYKANRERNFEPYPEVRQLTLKFPGRAFYHPRLEADDVLAVMTHPDVRGKTQDIVLVTMDRDLWQFVGRPHVKVWYKDHVVQVAEMVARFGVYHCRSVALVKALFGDTTDNVPPAFPGLKHQPLLNLINEHEIFNPAAFQAHVEELPSKAADRIVAEWETLERNWKLVKLPSKARGLRTKDGPANPDALVAYLEQFKCKSLYDPVRVLWSA